MKFLITILILFGIDAIHTRSRFKASIKLPHDEKSENLSNNRKGTLTNVAKGQNEFLALLIFDDETLARRTLSESHHYKSKETSEEDLEPRTYGKHKKRRHDKLKHIDESRDIEDDTQEDSTETLRDREMLGLEKAPLPSALRSACLRETNKGIEKCTRACNRAHEDVCDRLNCSVRSKKALRIECEFNCRKVFNPRVCY